MAMYMKPATHAGAHADMRFDWIGRAALTVAVGAILWFGLAPNRLLDLSRASGSAIHAMPGVSPDAAAGAAASK